MNILAIDTSTDIASIALDVEGASFVDEQAGVKQHAALLLPRIDSLLKRASTSVAALDAIVFGQGPGSFTGLRIACSVAKGLGFARTLPLYPVSGLKAIVNEVRQLMGDVPVLAMIDARMQQVYWGHFPKDSYLSPEKVTSIKEITLLQDAPFVLAGVGMDAYIADLPESMKAHVLKQCTVFPKASAMIRLVNMGLITPVSVADAQPQYVRNKVTEGRVTGG